MKVTVNPHSLGLGGCQESGVEHIYCFGDQRFVAVRQCLPSPPLHGRLTRRKRTTAGGIGRNVVWRWHVQGRQKCAEGARFCWQRRRHGSDVALEPGNNTPWPGELGAWLADDHRQRDWQRKPRRQDREPVLLMSVKTGRARPAC